MGGALSALCVSQLILLFAFRLPFLQGYGFGVALGLSLGACIGGFQWWILRKKFNRAYWWIVATALGTLISAFFQDVIVENWFDSLFPQLIVSAIFSGLAVGFIQWMFLAPKVSKALLWIPLSMLAQLLAQIPILPTIPIDRTTAPSATFMIQFIAFVVGQIMLNGLILGAVTGVPMSRFLQQQDEKRQP